MGKIIVLKQFWAFIKVQKKWWMGPLIALLLVMGLLLVLMEASVLAPFIYTIF